MSEEPVVDPSAEPENVELPPDGEIPTAPAEGEEVKPSELPVAEPPPAEVEKPVGLAVPEPRRRSRRKSMFEELKEVPGTKIPADNLATDLAGTLQSFFTQEDNKGDSAALKPLRRPKKVYDNSYRMESHNPYNRDRVQKVLDTTLHEMMDGVKYNSETANDIAVKIAEKLRARILTLRFDRYKIIVIANIGPLNRQGLHIGYRCLWDPDRDTHNYASYKNPHAFCTAVVYGIYFE